MFETAELGQSVARKEYQRQVPALREKLLAAQIRLRQADFPVIVVFAGVDGAGKSETANLLNEWLDPRGIDTYAYGARSEEEAERPDFWRFWRDLPLRGRIGVFLSAWYSAPLLERVYGSSTDAAFDRRLERIAAFEQTLVDDGALILKFWMHLGRKAQRRRFKTLEKDPLQSWRITELDWKHWRMYDQFVDHAERLIMRTSTGEAPWEIIEGEDECFRSLEFGNRLLDAIERRLQADERRMRLRVVESAPAGDEPEKGASDPADSEPSTILSRLDMSRSLTKKEYRYRVDRLQGELNRLQRQMRERKLTTILLFQGWDAAGKGGAIRRITRALDARDFQVISVAAPTAEELRHHYLWRFWRDLPRAGRVTIFDRSWYGRVLVERVEGFATEREWQRAYAEINDFEAQLVDHGITVVKFWLHITKDEQKRRFDARSETPHKRWKLTEEDWRNRAKWDRYAVAVNDMVGRTSTRVVPWVLVEGNDKRFARVKVLKTVCDRMKTAVRRAGGKT